MEYNECDICGAKDGRAGMLIRCGNGPEECLNCRDTRERGEIVIHSYLPRTNEEIRKICKIVE